MKKNKNSLLWRIRKEGLPGDSYLFGTMHVRDERAFVFEEAANEKILECDAFAIEVNIEEANFNLSGESLNLPEGTTLRTLLHPKKYKKVEKLLMKLTGMELSQFDNSLPILVSNFLTDVILSKDRMVSLDHSLWSFAKEHGKITLGIETLEEQVQIMFKIPIDYQVRALLGVAKDFKKYRKEVLSLAKLYGQADVQKIFKKAKKTSGGLRKLMLYNRNVIMADRISRLIEEQTIVCAVGAAHLGGKKGVIRLLKQKGFELKPVLSNSDEEELL